MQHSHSLSSVFVSFAHVHISPHFCAILIWRHLGNFALRLAIPVVTDFVCQACHFVAGVVTYSSLKPLVKAVPGADGSVTLPNEFLLTGEVTL